MGAKAEICAAGRAMRTKLFRMGEIIPGTRTTEPSIHKSVEIYKPGRTRGEVLVNKPDWGFTSYTTPDGSKALVLEQT